MRRKTLSILALTVLLTAACGTDDDQSWIDSDENTAAETPTPEMRAKFTALRSEVDSVVGQLRSQVETRQQGVTGDTLEAWTDTSANVAERRGDLLMKLDDLESASVDEVHGIRNDVASELAELEADVVRQSLRFDSDHEAASQSIEEHLVRLEVNLDSIEAHARSVHGMAAGQQGMNRTQDARAMGGAAGQGQQGDTVLRDMDNRSGAGAWGGSNQYDHVPDMDVIQNLREDIQETRRDAAELRMSTGDDRMDRLDGVADQVADLTREVRRHWYNVRYTFTGSGAMDRERMDGSTQY